MRAAHQQQAEFDPDEVLSIWCDHIDRWLPGDHDETASTEEEKATTGAHLEATLDRDEGTGRESGGRRRGI